MSEHSRLRQLMNLNLIAPISYFFARFMAQQSSQGEDSLIAWTAALLSERNQRGDVCIRLSESSGRHFLAAELRTVAGTASTEIPSLPLIPEVDVWRQTLLESGCVATPGQQAPLILDQDALYLSRLWRYEEHVAQAILARGGILTDIDSGRLRTGLMRMFGAQKSGDPVNWQMLASALAVSRRFAVISGGPGTGKTTTVIKVLALLLEQNPDLVIRLAAPTGKAAARMVESIRSRKHEIDMENQIRALIPEQASTLHRLLSYDGKRFRRNHADPLVADCLVVDEASMIDLTLMMRLLDAMPAHCRLILLGDRDQLASVEAGNVLGDITGHGREIRYSARQVAFLASVTDIAAADLPLDGAESTPADAVGLLRTSYRFHAESGIGRLARFTNAGNGASALQLLQESGNSSAPFDRELHWLAAQDQHIAAAAIDWAVGRYADYLRRGSVQEALEVFNSTRVLCAMHSGSLGEIEVNRRIEERLAALGLLGEARGGEAHEHALPDATVLRHGKPVMVTVNDYELGLFNGDIGLLWRDSQGELRAWFPQIGGAVRDLPAASLPVVTPAWALTVHKSQGSEFDQVLLILPEDDNSALLSRELIYTGITRAKEKVIVQGRESAFVRGCSAYAQRSSGLGKRLGW